MFSHPANFQTPSDMANKVQGDSRWAANGTNVASPEPTGGFLNCLSVRIWPGFPGHRRTVALSPQDAPQMNSGVTQNAISVVKPAAGSVFTPWSALRRMVFQV